MISRRLFLRNTAAAGAVGTAAVVPVAATEPEMTLHELASYHARQLADAMGQIDQTMTYRVTIDIEHAFALIAGHKRKGVAKVHFDDGSPLRTDDVTGTSAYSEWEARS